MIEGTKKFSEMTAKELQFARADLQYRLQSTLRPSRVLNLLDDSVVLEGGALQAWYDHNKQTLYVHSTGGKRYAGREISVAQLTHAQNVLKRFYARAHGLDIGGVDL